MLKPTGPRPVPPLRRANTEPDLVNFSGLFGGAGTKRKRSRFTAQSDEDLNGGPSTRFPPRHVRAKHGGLGRLGSMPGGRAPGENAESGASAAKSTTGILVAGSYWLKNKVPHGLRCSSSLPDADNLAVMTGIMLEDSASLDEMQHRSRGHSRILEIASRPTQFQVEELLRPAPEADAAGCGIAEHAVLGFSPDACLFQGEQPRHSVLCVSLPCTPYGDRTNEAVISEFIDADGSPGAVESTLALLSRASACL